ncbi:methyltransferase domain-containing protein [Amycolatopsis suaedae]|uniref:Methyltransferase domain-containing protein n=1 Tax=Amycolatopsis suaedae TaxID=2510978 RepID=A0A4Q7J5P0_9PSEU|nr:methyltransferase domain-containing protein [Amycolatopsis suaedae]RZQ62429.1 methyltransferase domain-containing protein [Amycolatopsis suaedae]
MTATRLVARTVRGIERVLAGEVRDRGLGTVEQLDHREVWFRCPDPGPGVLDLRCADDVFLVGTVVHGVGRARSGLRLLADAVKSVPVPELLATRARCAGRPAGAVAVDVSASFLGRRNFTRYDVEDAVGEPLATALGLPYHSRRAGVAPPADTLAWRVTLTGDRALLALRIGRRPLHRRRYRRVSLPGALHPPLAAAMVRLAGPFDGARLLDPCCGVGTVAVEAARSGTALSIVAGDVNPAAVAAAAANGVGTAVAWTLADAGRLPVASGSVDLVVTNPPWGRQVSPAGTLARRPPRFWTELRRVLRPDGRAVLLVPDAAALLAGAATHGLTPVARRAVSLSGAHPEVVTLEPVP